MNASDAVLRPLRSRLDQIYGNRLRRALLFGSRARGDARDDSDYDVAIFVEGLERFVIESERLAEIEVDLLQETGAIINVLPFSSADYAARTALMSEVRRDGLDF